jgi:beta,beta-carotene 9',10'-dioxygenase
MEVFPMNVTKILMCSAVVGIGVALGILYIRQFPLTSLEEEQRAVPLTDQVEIVTEGVIVDFQTDAVHKKATNMHQKENICVSGDISLAFTSQPKEILRQNLPVVSGTIPPWLSGNLFRTGPALFEHGQERANCWFDGCAMVYNFEIKDGQVVYSNRLLQTDYLRQVKSGGNFGVKKEKKGGLFSRLGSLLTSDTKPTYDNANGNIWVVGDELCAVTETPLATRFDPDTLKNQRFVFDDKDNFEAHYACSHGLVDSATGDVYNYYIQFGRTSTYIITKIPAGTTRRIPVANISVGYPSYMHSFALTKNYVVLIETPLRVNPIDFVMGDKSFLETYNWKPKQGSKFIVINKKTGAVEGTYQADPFFFMHTMNAYEDDHGDKLIFDIATHKDPAILFAFTIRTPKAKQNPVHPQAFPTRFVLSLKTGKVTHQKLAPQSIELPRINEQYRGLPYRYVYGTHIPKGENIASDLLKLNVDDGGVLTWHEPDCYPGEPVFVANPKGKTEDDGVVLSVVLDLKVSKSFLLILDAKTMKELARAYLPYHLPLDSHGIFVPKNPEEGIRT